MKWVNENFQHTKDLYPPKHLSEMFYSDDDMTKESKITPVPTVFLLRHYQSTYHQKIVPPKEYCRHRCNFRFFYYYNHYYFSVDGALVRAL